MNFHRSGRRDDVFFVGLVLLPLLIAGLRYRQSDREMTQIAQAQQQRAAVADATHAPDRRVVLARNQVR